MNLSRLHPAEQLVQVMDRIYRQGLTTTSGGNLSVRTEDGDLWITPRGVDKGALTPGDIVRVAPDGSAQGRHRPSVELPFHQVVYRSRPDLRGVVHAHAAGLVAFSLVRRIPDTALVRGTQAACGRVGMAAYGLPGSAALGDEIGRVFAEGADAVLLENHGAVAGGADLARAFVAFETLEHCARLELEARRLGAPVRIPDDALAQAEAHGRAPLEETAARAPDAGERRARDEVVAFVRRACAQGLFSSALGSLSVRLGGGAFLVTPADLDRLHLEPKDLVRIEAGRREAGKRPDAWVRFHAAVHARQPHAGAVILGCPPSLGAFAATAEPFDTRTIPECYIVLRDVPTLPFGATSRDAEATADRLTAAAPVAIVQGEGAIATGATLLQAFDRLEVAEHSARGLVACRSLGPRVKITDDQIDAIRRAFSL